MDVDEIPVSGNQVGHALRESAGWRIRASDPAVTSESYQPASAAAILGETVNSST